MTLNVANISLCRVPKTSVFAQADSTSLTFLTFFNWLAVRRFDKPNFDTSSHRTTILVATVWITPCFSFPYPLSHTTLET